MSTRSVISFRSLNGCCTGVYCHSDGYPRVTGQILNDHYTTAEQVQELLKLGSLSILGAELGDAVDFNYARDHPEQCIAYGRDRGETGQEANGYVDFAEMQESIAQEYTYVFDAFTNMWFMAEDDNERLRPLSIVLLAL